MLGAIAQFETKIRAERQMDGIQKAKDRGVRLGRKKQLTEQQVVELRRRREQGELIKNLMKDYGLSKSSISLSWAIMRTLWSQGIIDPPIHPAFWAQTPKKEKIMGTRTEQTKEIIGAATEVTPDYMRRTGWHQCTDVQLDENQAFAIEDQLANPDYTVSATRTCAGFIVWNHLA